MRRILTGVAFAVLVGTALGGPKKTPDAQQRELETLKEYLSDARDSLQAEVTDRWRRKQRFVEQREIDKEMLTQLRETQERTFTELSQAKEEAFARERILEDERKAAEAKQQEWNYTFTAFDEAFDKEVKVLSSANPIDLERRRAALEEIRRALKRENRSDVALQALIDYYLTSVRHGLTARIGNQVILPDEGEPQEMRVVRFGDVFAYALTTSGEPYVIRQTGKLDAGRYAVEKVGSSELALSIQESLPGWVDRKHIDGLVSLDVMQNANAGILISGKKVSTATAMLQWFKAGGLVMGPLIILMVWAVVLVVLKLVLYSRKHKSNRNLYDAVAAMLAENRNEDAREYAAQHKGVVARVVTACLDHSKRTRSSAEKAVREILVEETPQLHKHLATLAVIAGAAPLLGLLGTVTGMISLFEVITHYGTGDPKILAGGISEALITTQMGLAVSIPILLIHNRLRNQSLHIQSEMEKHAIRILNRLWPETA